MHPRMTRSGNGDFLRRVLPADLAGLSSLTELDVSLNRLSQLPDAWWSSSPGLSSSALVYAAINGNQLKVAPGLECNSDASVQLLLTFLNVPCHHVNNSVYLSRVHFLQPSPQHQTCRSSTWTTMPSGTWPLGAFVKSVSANHRQQKMETFKSAGIDANKLLED